MPPTTRMQVEVVDDTYHFFAMSMLYRRVTLWFESHQGLDAVLGNALPPLTRPPRNAPGDSGGGDGDGGEGGGPSRATRRRNALADLGLDGLEIVGGGEFLDEVGLGGDEEVDGEGEAELPGGGAGLAHATARRVAALRAMLPGGGAGSGRGGGGGGGAGGGGGGGGGGSSAEGGPWTLGDTLTTTLGKALLPCIVLRQYIRSEEQTTVHWFCAHLLRAVRFVRLL
jgi:hypothetical protein